MSIIDKLLSGFKSSAASLVAEIQQLNGRVEKLRQERDKILTAPATKEDVKAMLQAWVADQRGWYGERLHKNLNQFIVDPLSAMKPEQVKMGMSLLGRVEKPAAGIFAGPKLTDGAVCFLVGDAVVKALHTEIDAMAWPPNAMPLGGRDKRLQELDEEIAELTTAITKVAGEAGNAGITFDNLPVSSPHEHRAHKLRVKSQ